MDLPTSESNRILHGSEFDSTMLETYTHPLVLSKVSKYAMYRSIIKFFPPLLEAGLKQ
jgi:hypothetical protein